MTWGGAGRPVQAPPADSAIPNVLDGPGSPARLAYHPLETRADPEGWASEQILFWGRDGQWRSLNMGELGLPESWWPGKDTYGAGSLSADGRTWAAHTNAGVVFVDLTTGVHRHVPFPRTTPMVRYLTWIPGDHAVSAYARKPHGSRYSTFRVGPNGRLTSANYDGSRTRFDVDGTPVETKTSGRTLTMIRWETTGTESTQWDLPVRFPSDVQWAVFGQHDVAIVQASRSIRKPVTVWVFDKHNGQPRARLRVPPTTSIEGWTEGALVLLIDNRRLITWNPRTGGFQRLFEIPGPFPGSRDWAATTVSLPGL